MTMSDSGSESSSSDSNNEERAGATTPEGSVSPQSRYRSKSPSSHGSSMSGPASPASGPTSPGSGPGSPGFDARSPGSGPASPASGPASPSTQASGPASPEDFQISGPASPASAQVYPKSPVSAPSSPKSQDPDYGPASPKSDSDDEEDAASDHSSCPHSPKNFHYEETNSGDNSHHHSETGRSSVRSVQSADRSSPASLGCPHMEDPISPKSYVSEANSMRSRQSGSRHSTPKSPTCSGRSSPKSPRSPPGERQLCSPPAPAIHTARDSEYEMDGEQISDGEMDADDVNERAKIAGQETAQLSHGEDLSDVSDLDSAEEEPAAIAVADGDHQQNQRPHPRQDKQDPAVVNSHETTENGPSALGLPNDTADDEIKNNKAEAISATNAALNDESEQLDFEADGQWKDVKEDGDTELKESKELKDAKKNDVNCTELAKPKEQMNKDKNKDKSKEKLKAKEKDAMREAGEINDKEDAKEDGEKVESELEEGELSDGDEARPEETEPRPVCRFYNRGQCTWGVSCRFLHPGVTDKGNYTMFDMVRPMAYPPPHPPGPHEFRPHIERPPMARPPMPGYGPPVPHHPPKPDDAVSESAWERGLRHAKEMMRKANKRKESDMDFEEKKMNLSIGQDDLDREAGYYVRPASPEPPVERWPPAREAPPRRGAPRVTPDHYAGEPDPYYHASAPPEYYRRVHYKEPRTAEYRERVDYHMVARSTPHSISPSPHPPDPREREREYYHRGSSSGGAKYEKKHKRPSREVIVERIPSAKTWREEEPPPIERGRGDEWADPWMRRKSPGSLRRRHATSTTRHARKQSYSSGSSYSSSSSSRSSSRTSYSSYESVSRSRSPSPPSRSRVSSKKIPPSPPPSSVSSHHRGGGGGSGGTAAATAAMLMNPPAPSPRASSKPMSSPSMALHRRALNPPAPSPLASHLKQREKARDKAALAAAAVAKVIKSHSRSRSSQSSSGSDSSGSSSDSSDSSYSSSSSAEVRRRKVSSPPLGRKDLKEVLKLSGSKLKMSLKPQQSSGLGGGSKKSDRSSIIAGKKRGLIDSPPPMDKASAAAAAKAAKKASTRREELLKQLKAVEDAIARKRSKV